jgi:hypothetical protein
MTSPMEMWIKWMMMWPSLLHPGIFDPATYKKQVIKALPK